MNTPSHKSKSDSASRPKLSTETVVEAAVKVLDEDGVAALSMRRLGRELGVEGMTLYRYVPSSGALLDAVVDTVVDDQHADPAMLITEEESWREYLTRVALGVRRVALAHPNIFPLIASRPPAAPWVRPPLRSLHWIEAFLAGLQSKGFSDEDSVSAYRSFTSFLLGHLTLELNTSGTPIPETPSDDPVPEPNWSEYPTVARLADQLGESVSEVEFDKSLVSVLDRIEATL